MGPKGQYSAVLILMSTILGTSNIVIEIYQITDSSAWALLPLLGSAIPTCGIFLPRILALLPIHNFLLLYGRCSKTLSVSIMKMHKPRAATAHRITILLKDRSCSNFVFCLKLSNIPVRSMVAFWEVKDNQTGMVIYFFLNVSILVWQAHHRIELLSIEYTHLLFLGLQQWHLNPGEINSWSH